MKAVLKTKLDYPQAAGASRRRIAGGAWRQQAAEA